jgi:ABC-type spermidine/putrescine transport system permease subunit II
MPRVAWWGVCSALTLLFLSPLYVMVAQSLKDPEEAAATPPTLYPHALSTENYQGLSSGEGINVFDHVGNSAMVSVGATIATVVLSTLGGYAFARLRFPGSNIVFFATLATFMIPFQAIITPLYIVLKDFGLQNSLLGLMIVYTTFQLPFGLFLMRNSFASIPSTLEEAALVDGCGTLGAMWRVMLPVAVPGADHDRAVHVLHGVERVLRRAHPDLRPGEVHPARRPHADLVGHVRRDRLGPAAGGRRDDDRPLHRHLPGAPALLRGRAAQRSGEAVTRGWVMQGP